VESGGGGGDEGEGRQEGGGGGPAVVLTASMVHWNGAFDMKIDDEQLHDRW
jgi:hypothetical protein